MSMKNYFATMENCRHFLRENPNVKEAFENMQTSNCSGFEYTLKTGVSIKMRVDRTIDFLILEVYPGITVRGPHLSMVAEYCQRVTDCPGEGYLAVATDQRSVYYHCESCFADNPITVKLLQKMENKAIAVLEEHAPVIDCLAYGRLPECTFPFPEADNATESDTDALSNEELSLLQMNIEEIRAHFTDAGHNVVAENLNSDSDLRYYLETLSNDMRYRESIHIRRDGWLFRTLRLDLKCGVPFRTQLSQYCNAASDGKKVGFLKIDRNGMPSCTVATYLLDGEKLISEKTLKKMGGIAATFLKSSEEKLIYIGHGVLPPEDNDDDALDEIAKGMLGRMSGAAHRDKSEERSSSPSSLFDLFASLRDESDDDDDDLELDLGGVSDLLDMLPDMDDDNDMEM